MKEFFALLKQGKFKAIFIEPTANNFLQFFRYVFVGGIATVVDWILSFGTERLLSATVPSLPNQFIYMIATTIGFGAGLVVNFLLSRAFVFAAKKARAKTKTGEFAGHLIVGGIGLGMSYLIVWVGTKFLLKDAFMLFRIIATLIVFVWNYLARKFFVYKK